MRIKHLQVPRSILLGAIVTQGQSLTANSPDLPLNGSINAGNFDYYLRQGFGDIVLYDASAQMVVVDSKPIDDWPTTDPAQFISMKVTGWLPRRQKAGWVYNWGHRDPAFWSPIRVGPLQDYQEHLGTWTFAQRTKTLAQVFGLLRRARKLNAWSYLVIAKFKNPPAGHDEQIF